MCLIKNRVLPRFSTKPIKVYKVLRLLKDGNYQTPITRTKVEIGGEIIASKSLLYTWLTTFIKDFITREGVHGYRFKWDTDSYFDKCYLLDGRSRVVAECTIPPFTLFWLDAYDSGIAARKMIVDKIINC